MATSQIVPMKLAGKWASSQHMHCRQYGLRIFAWLSST